MHKYFLLLFGILSIKLGQSQFVQIGEGSFLGTFAGPIRTIATQKTFQSKFAYIFPKSTLGNLKNGDSITSIEFFRADGTAIPQKNKMKIWITTTNRSDFGTVGIDFLQETTGATKVFDTLLGNYFGSNEGFYPLPFSAPFKYDSIYGENIALYVQFDQVDTMIGTFSFYFEGSQTVSGYANRQTQFSFGSRASDTLNNITEYKPTIIFNFPREDIDAEIRKVYTLGKIPLPLGNPDSVKVFVRNVGKKDWNNLKFYTFSKGKNNQKDSFYADLPIGKEKFLVVPSLNPTSKGIDTIYVESSDKFTHNNLAYSVRLGNENIYSYRDITLSPAGGGIGFNNAKGDFVARFQSNKSKYINQISVAFAGSGRLFKVGVWSYDSIKARPGKLIFESDSLITVSGTYILDLKKPVLVNGSFYVGVRQLDLNNVAFGYQLELPVRPQTFFYATPLGDTNWVDFHPNAPYKFIIEPRLQADYDFRAVSVEIPKDTVNINDNDTIGPKLIISNVGALMPSDSVEIVCEIRGLNQLHYKESIFDTLSPGLSRTYNFSKKFIASEYGEHSIIAYVRYKDDRVNDNDTVYKKFYSGVDQDVMVRTVHDPFNFNTYVYNVDTLMPLATILNVGYDNTSNFNVTCEIKQQSKILYSKSQNISLPKFQSRILFWPTYKFNDTGKLLVSFFTSLKDDKNTLNDTIKRFVIAYKKTDFIADTIFTPNIDSTYQIGNSVKFSAKVKNDGILELGKIPVYIEVKTPSNKLLYLDSAFSFLFSNSDGFVNFPKSIKLSEKGVYKMKLYARGIYDIYRQNDTFYSTFMVGRPVDFLAEAIYLKDTLSIGSVGYKIESKIGNLGFDPTLVNTAVKCDIFKNGVRLFSDELAIKIDTSTFDTIVFAKVYNPVIAGNHQVLVYLSNSIDGNKFNDTIKKNVVVEVGKDALVETINKPLDNSKIYLSDELDTIKLTIANQGRDTMFNLLVNYQIYDPFNDLISSSFMSVDGFPNSSQNINFLCNCNFKQKGRYKLLVYTSHIGDQNKFNDTQISYFFVKSKRDLAIVYLDSPAFNGQTRVGDKFFPIATIKNNGEDSNSLSGRLIYRVTQTSSNTKIFETALNFPEINPDSSRILKFNDELVFNSEGIFSIECFAENNTDENRPNDTLSGFIQIFKNSLNAINLDQLRVFPTILSSGKLNIQSTNPIQNIYFVNSVGQNVMNIPMFNKSQNEVNIDYNTFLIRGVYFCVIVTSANMVSVPVIIE